MNGYQWDCTDDICNDIPAWTIIQEIIGSVFTLELSRDKYLSLSDYDPGCGINALSIKIKLSDKEYDQACSFRHKIDEARKHLEKCKKDNPH